MASNISEINTHPMNLTMVLRRVSTQCSGLTNYQQSMRQDALSYIPISSGYPTTHPVLKPPAVIISPRKSTAFIGCQTSTELVSFNSAAYIISEL